VNADASAGAGSDSGPPGGADVLRLTGALDFESLPGVIAESEKYIARPDLPQRLTIDFSDVAAVDSSAVALLLEWLRRAREKGVALEFANLPANLLALAQLYGVREMIQPEISGAAP
jgi:phospholipid transport system transporter-binding protein